MTVKSEELRERKARRNAIAALMQDKEVICLTQRAYILTLALAIELACKGREVKAKITKGYDEVEVARG